MQVSKCVECREFPCADVRHECYIIPNIDLRPEEISIILISEAAPADLGDYYFSEGNPLFQQTTVQAFKDAGADVSSIQDILDLGVYLTTAVKCGKTGYGIKAETIKECSLILEEELALFPNVRVFLLMGDIAIKAINYIAKRTSEGRVIPAGSTNVQNSWTEVLLSGDKSFSIVSTGRSELLHREEQTEDDSRRHCWSIEACKVTDVVVLPNHSTIF